MTRLPDIGSRGRLHVLRFYGRKQSNLATAGKDTTLAGPVTPKRPPPPRGAGLQRGDLSLFWAGVEATLALSKGVGGHQGITGCISFTLNTRGKCEGLPAYGAFLSPR